MKKLIQVLMPLVAISLFVGCGRKTNNNEESVKKDAIEEKGSKNNDEEGYEDENGHIVSFKEVKEKMTAYDEAIKQEDLDEALSLEAWLKANSHQNGMTEEEIERVDTNHGGLVELARVKEAIQMAKEREDMSTEHQAVNGLRDFKETLTTDELLEELFKKYESQVDEVYDELSKKTGIPRDKDEVKNDRIGSGDEDYDEDGNYIEGGDDVSDDPISLDKVESSDDVYGD